MIRRTRNLNIDEDSHNSGLATLASVSDLMVSLLAVFVATTAITLARLNEVTSQLNNRKQAAVASAPRVPPDSGGRAPHAWGMNAQEFERRQLAMRVHAAWEKAFTKIPGVIEPASNTIVVELPRLARGDSAGESIEASLAPARDAIAVAQGTDWNSYQTGGCELALGSGLTLFFGVPRATESARFEEAHAALNAFSAGKFRTRVEGVLELRARPESRLLITFHLDPKLRKVLQDRFRGGPGASGSADKAWCR